MSSYIIEYKDVNGWRRFASLTPDDPDHPFKDSYEETQRVIEAIRNSWTVKPAPPLSHFRVKRA